MTITLPAPIATITHAPTCRLCSLDAVNVVEWRKTAAYCDWHKNALLQVASLYDDEPAPIVTPIFFREELT